MKKIAITGGIGAGKTTVCRIFETLDVPVYYADERSKWLTDHDPDLRNALKNLFGNAIYDPETQLLRRQEVAKLVFAEPDLLAQLNALVHPAVARDSAQWLQKNADAPYTLKESALIFELGLEADFDAVVAVLADVEVRIARVQNRNGWNRDTILKRIEAQMPDPIKAQRAHFCIDNNGNLPLIPQILAIHQAILQNF